jgi:hypothetical protein
MPHSEEDGMSQYLFLVTTVLSPIIMIVALCKVIITAGLRRKWVWGFISFVGLFSFRMNWDSGIVTAKWLTIRVMGFGIVHELGKTHPWYLTVTLPIGALLILTGIWANPSKAKINRGSSGVEKTD